MAVVIADIQAMPGLSGISNADATFWLDMSEQFVHGVFPTGDVHDRATKLWCAHALTLQTQSGMGSAAAVQSKRVGDVSVSYGAPQSVGSLSWLQQTQWGKLFLQMARVYSAPSYPVV